MEARCWAMDWWRFGLSIGCDFDSDWSCAPSAPRLVFLAPAPEAVPVFALFCKSLALRKRDCVSIPASDRNCCPLTLAPSFMATPAVDVEGFVK